MVEERDGEAGLLKGGRGAADLDVVVVVGSSSGGGGGEGGGFHVKFTNLRAIS